ncbi:MAG: hypothetical protein JXR83_05340 [Deltaproteobacteria bacterium]|nr:hypothetical protein [Deltaproteobacteria bacterium]
MKRAHLARAQLLSSVALLALGACACFEPNGGTPEPLPYWAQNKAYFSSEHEWWMQRTVIDTPYNVTFTFIGDGDLADRIRWKIEEKYLIAERSRSLAVGADPDTVGLDGYRAPVAIYPILRHFDVIDGQIVEAPKRPWYDRQWMQVDWSQESSGTYRFVLNTVALTGPRYTISKPDDPERPVFAEDYFDFTTHVTVSPTEQIDPEGRLQQDYCLSWRWGAIDIYDCAPADIAFRTAFRRIPSDHDYLPLRLDQSAIGKRMWNSVWRTGRYVIDNQYGLTEYGLDLLATRFNIWQRVRDEQGNPIPYRDRVLRPIVYYVNGDFPVELVDETQRAIDQWDVPFRTMVRELRQWECVDAGEGDLAACDRDEYEPERVVYLCPNNPVAAGDPGVCGEPGTSVRLGDMRYNLLAWITAPKPYTMVGTTWWSPDILTSEIVNAHIQIFGNDIDRTAADARDLILFVTGRIELDDFVNGDYLDDWLDQLGESANPFWSIRNYPGVSTIPTPFAAAPRRAGAMLPNSSASTAGMASYASWSSSILSRDEALAPIVGTTLEPLAIDSESLLLQGIADAQNVGDPAALHRASPLQHAFREAADARGALAGRLAEVGIDLDVPFDVNLEELIDTLGGAEPDVIYQEIRSRFAFATIVHELGHGFGFRHNFMASYDALNYFPQYWDLRDDGHVGPRYDDPLTAAEQTGRIWEYTYSSVMDYLPSANASRLGIGYYDVALIKALYGDLVEMFEVDNGVTVAGNEERWKALYNYRPLALVPIINVPDATSTIGHHHDGFHYSSQRSMFGDISKRRFVPLSHLQDHYGWGLDVSDADGRIRVPYLFCEDEMLGVYPVCSQYDMGADPYEIVSYLINFFESNYPVHSFRRARLNYNLQTYIQAMWSRVFYTFKILQAYQTHFHWEWDLIEPGVFASDKIYLPMEKAVALSFNFLGRLLTTPEAGPHELTAFPVGATTLTPCFYPVAHADPPPQHVDLEIPLGSGRYYKSNTKDTPHGMVLTHVGSAVDKELALETLLDPSFFYFPGRETWEDPVLWMPSFYRTYPKQLIDLIGGLVAGDWRDVGPRADANGVHYRDFLDLDSTAPGTAVDPAIGYNLRIRILIYGFGLMFAAYADRTMLEYARIVPVGSGDEFTCALPSVDFTDPWTGKTYRAYSYLEGSRELGIGARLLQFASALAAAHAAATDPTDRLALEKLLRRQIEVIEIARQLVQRYDETLFAGVANERP